METKGYVCFFGERRWECYADSLSTAKLMAVAHFKPTRSKQHLVSAHLAEVDGKVVVHIPNF